MPAALLIAGAFSGNEKCGIRFLAALALGTACENAMKQEPARKSGPAF